MKRIMRLTVALVAVSATLLLGLVPAASAGGKGAVQVSGQTVPGADCGAGPAGTVWESPDYAFAIEGDLEGCIYGAVTSFNCTPSGMYQERADELFVEEGTGDSFEMTEFFWAKFIFGETCNFDTIEAQVFGGCKHPIVAGTGTGGWEGVTGRLDFKDDVSTGIAHYKGHLRMG